MIIIAAEAGEFAVDLAEAFPAFGRIAILIEQVLGVAHEFHGHEAGEAVGEGAAFGGLFEGVGAFDDDFGEAFGVAMAEPIGVAALFPVGEVLFVDGAVVEEFPEDFLDGCLLVEPGDDVDAEVAVFEAMADFVADGFGEAGDFAVVVGGHRFWFFATETQRSQRRGWIGFNRRDAGFRIPPSR